MVEEMVEEMVETVGNTIYTMPVVTSTLLSSRRLAAGERPLIRTILGNLSHNSTQFHTFQHFSATFQYLDLRILMILYTIPHLLAILLTVILD